ncbi:MAG: glycosyltransferase family 2 protein [Clostridiaceae bacterium]|nr:glycosyltransferase family 2 protein [Clostridiaceae bacterium]
MEIFVHLFLFSFSYIVQLIVFILSVYYLIIMISGWIPFPGQNTNKNKVLRYHRFAVVIPAHNEERVIRSMVGSLNKQQYPKELFDIFVICDNCTDNTEYEAGKAGTQVLVRYNDTEKGKGYALEWAFARIFALKEQYDAICVFDADNVVSGTFLNEINKMLNDGHEVIQGYIDSKNPFDSWISLSYSIAFWLSNRIFQLTRYNLGLSCGLCGTGFCIRTSVLKELGWGATCLTEDLEFTMKLILNNKKVAFCKNAVVYDEKPLTFIQSWKQRKRWMQGHTDCAKRYLPKLLKKSFVEGNLMALDGSIYLIQPVHFICFGLAVIISWLKLAFPSMPFYIIGYSFPADIWSLIVLIQISFGPLIVLFDKKWDVRILIGFLVYPVYCLTWLPVTITGIKDSSKKDWEHTTHTRDIPIEEIERS